MTLTELHYLIAVARERHFGRAAENCHVSQPTLSVAVKKLEDELGVTIFERGKNEVTVTEIGKMLVEQAHRIAEDVEQFKSIAGRGKDQLATPFKLGAIFTIGPYLFPHLVPILKDDAQQMPLILEENYTANLAAQLKRGDVDAIIVALPFEEPGVVTLPLYEEPFVAVVPKNHEWNRRKSVSATELAEDTLLLLGPGHCFRDQVLSACPECNRSTQSEFDIQRTVEGSSLETIRMMVASGLGITVLPQSAVLKDPLSTSLTVGIPFNDPIPSRTVAIAWRVSFPRPKAIEIVRQAIEKVKLFGKKLPDSQKLSS